MFEEITTNEDKEQSKNHIIKRISSPINKWISFSTSGRYSIYAKRWINQTKNI